MMFANINYKKIGLIFVFLIVSGAIGYFIFALFFQQKDVIQTGQEVDSTEIGTGLPEAGTGTQTPIDNTTGQLPNTQTPNRPSSTPDEEIIEDNTTDLEVSATSPKISSSGQLQYYNESDGKFYQLSANGEAIALSDKQFFNVEKVVWAPTGSKAILEFPDGSKIRYNFNTKEQVTLPKHWQDFDFSPTGDKIVAKSMGIDASNRWLITANDDGSKARRVEELGDNGDKVISSWSPNNQSVALFVDGVDFNNKEVYFVGQNKENFKSMIVAGRGFEPQWSPKGDELLYSVYSSDNDYKPMLWLAGAQGDTIGANRRPIGLNTWASKCSFASSMIYCAVPTSLERGAGLFPQTADSTPDNLFRINPKTGIKEQINLGSNAYTMKNLSVSPDGQYLYFTDASTGTLRKIKLN